MTVLLAATAILAASVTGCPSLTAAHPVGPERIHSIEYYTSYSEPGPRVRFGDHVVFVANDGIHGRELWKTDGSEEGTRMLVNVNPHEGSNPSNLVVVDDHLLFWANDGVHGRALWRSDGTEMGTAMIQPVNAASSLQHQTSAVVGDVLYFSGTDSLHGYELWRTDGTASGTWMVKNINPDGHSDPLHLTAVNETLFFSADDGTHNRQLWKSDGTVEGTELVKVLRTGDYGANPHDLVAVDGVLYFGAYTPSNDLWKTDGSEEGTILVRGGIAPSQAMEVDGRVFFSAVTGSSRDLWTSDGTTEGTYRVKDIYPEPRRSSSPRNLVDFKGQVYFTAEDGPHERELWTSDGTEEGTYKVKEIYPGLGSHPFGLTVVDSVLYFRASFPDETDGTRRDGLWKSDGTEKGTVRIAEISGSGFIGLDSLVLFHSTAGRQGGHLWRTDGTAAGTRLVKKINTTPLNWFRGLDRHLAFLAPNSENGGQDLWITDSDDSQFRLLHTFPDWPAPHVSIAETTNERLFFTVGHPSRPELWVSDGTAAGTHAISQVAPTPEMAIYNENLFFSGYTQTSGRELWTSDGTAEGTQIVADIRTGPSSSEPKDLTVAGDQIFFSADAESAGRELWVSDGTSNGTRLVKDIHLGHAPSNPRNLTAVGGKLYFTADDGIHGRELWTSDGTETGTFLVKNISPFGSANPDQLTEVHGILFFTADNVANGRELWKSDGTAEGTVLVRNISTSSAGSRPQNLVNARGTLYFTADHPLYGRELWKSDGSTHGTVMVRDIRPGSRGSTPAHLTAIDGTLFFTAADGIHGRELWRSDGTGAGTHIVMNLTESSVGSAPSALTNVNGVLFFAASRPGGGSDLYRLVTPPALRASPDNKILFSGEATNLIVEAGGGELTYTWYHDGYLIPEATGPSFSFDSLRNTDAGIYWVVIANSEGAVEASFRLAVDPDLPFIRDMESEQDGIHLTIAAPMTNHPHRIEASDDLLHWSPLKEFPAGANPSGEIRFLDTDSAEMDRRFYRAVLLP